MLYFHFTGHEHDSATAVVAEDILCEVCRSKSPKKANYYCDRCKQHLCLDCKMEHGNCTNTDHMESDLGFSQQTIQINEITVPTVTTFTALDHSSSDERTSAQTFEITPASTKEYQMPGRYKTDSGLLPIYNKRAL